MGGGFLHLVVSFLGPFRSLAVTLGPVPAPLLGYARLSPPVGGV